MATDPAPEVPDAVPNGPAGIAGTGEAGARLGSFRAFYPFYLSQHRNRTCRRMHFAGTALALATLPYALISGQTALLWLMPLFGYGFAWTAHLFVEKNRPATFKAPLYSLLGDFVMARDMLLGRIRF